MKNSRIGAEIKRIREAKELEAESIAASIGVSLNDFEKNRTGQHYQ